MKERAMRLFNLYTGEAKQALFFALLAFVLFFAASLGWKLSDALFIIHLSASKLPLAYGTISCALIGCVTLILYAYHRYTPTHVFYKLLLLATIFYGLITLSLITGIAKSTPWTWFILKVCNHIVYIQMLSCFWTFLDQYYHFQDAKRLYTLFNSSIYLGLTCTGIVIQTGLLDLVQIFALIFALLLLVLIVAPKITKGFDIVPDDSEVELTGSQEQNSWKLFFKTLITSRFTLYLMAGCLISYLLMTTTEIGYLTSFQHYFGAEKASSAYDEASFRLTRFYGICLTTVGVINLITGWFFYSRLVLRFGVNTLAMITPIGFLITFSGWSFDSSLLFPLIGFIVVESLYPVIEDNNFNLLLNAVPLKLKPSIRVMIESFLEPSGMLISAILLSCAFIDWKFLGLLLAIVSFAIAATIRSQYYKAIFMNLKDHALSLHKTAREWLSQLSKKDKKITEEKLIQLFSHPDPTFQKLAIDVIFAYGRTNLLKRVLAIKNKLSKEAKIHFLTCVETTPFASETFVIDTINRWQEESRDRELQAAIDFFLAKSGLLHPEKAQYNLTSDIPLQKGAAILALQHSFAHQTLQSVTYNRTTALEELQHLLESLDLNELSLGITLLGCEGSQQSIEILIDYLKHSSLKIAKSAAFALAECIDSDDVRHAQTILEEIRERNDSEFRVACFKALSKIGHTALVRSMIDLSPILRPNEARLLEKIISDLGLKTVPTLVSTVVDTEANVRARIVAGKILAQLSLPQLNAHLIDVIRKEIERAYFYFYYGHTLPTEHEGHDLSLLKEGLLSNFQSVIDFIIQLLGASKWIEDSELIASSLRSKSPKITSQAIETLEMCCERSVFRLLYPLIGDLPFKEKLRFCVRFAQTDLTVSEVLEKMESTQNTLDLILATTWKYRLDLPNWRAMLRKQMASRQKLFHHFAYELLET